MTTKRGFTLIEICVVLAVVLILVALLFPVVGRMREQGRCAVCQSNLKQIAAATQQYVQDNNGRYPIVVTWTDTILPYVKDGAIFRCPTRQQPNPENPHTDYSYNWITLNRIVWWDSKPLNTPFGNTQFAGAHESSIAIPPAIVPLNEEGGPSSIDGGPDTDVIVTPGGQRLWVPALHSDGENVSYLDGHVEWRSKHE